MGAPARIARPGQPSDVEMVRIEDMSDHGARIVTAQRWQPGDGLIIYSQGQLARLAVGKVIYCQPLSQGHFVIGCWFDEGIGIQPSVR